MGERAVFADRRFRLAALMFFMSGWVVVVLSLLLVIDNRERYGSRTVPLVFGPFFIRPIDWLIGGFLLALACFVTAIVLKARDTAQARREGRRSGPLTRTGQVLLSIATCAVMGLALLNIALMSFFPVTYERLDLPDAAECAVVLETHTAMASQSGRIFQIPPGMTQLVDTGVWWSYDDGRLIDPVWSATWNGQEATLHAPEDLLGFNGGRSRQASFPCG